MKRSLVIGGSVGAGVLLILMAFPAVVNAQATKTTIKEMMSSTSNSLSKKSFAENIKTFQQLKDKISKMAWYPGYFFAIIGGWIIYIFLIMFGWLFGSVQP